ncbi:uncharacterized protein LOC122034761 [Zingiber officinale]|uniref:uncharacterized protein LOC122034761 n=1 Tax=Zingiber officinale TaxID=94328 RepID=UPI001C4A7FAB|nr:uncharacterized protein LOC122034761 [Zingiber officinale]
MGNCQTTDVVAVLIQHPDGRTEKANCPLSASHVMAANPGHYVAVVITLISQRRSSSSSASATADDRREKVVRYLKLLGPEEPLQLGHFYRLVSFEDVLREFGTKRRVRLSKLLSKKKEIIKKSCDGEANASAASSSPEAELEEEGMQRLGIFHCTGSAKQGQWRPTLQTIYEIAKL